MAATKSRPPKRRRSTGPKIDPYKLVTDRIIQALEAGFIPWQKPWRNARGESTSPMRLSHRKPYRGINVFVLWAASAAAGYESRWWGTYRQISELGGQVRGGEKSTPVVFWRIIEKKDADGKVVERIPLLRHFAVFNLDQADGVDDPVLSKDETDALADHEPIAACEEIVAGFVGRPEIRHGGNRAYYHPNLDYVQMPKLGQFESPETYHSTLFHELVHSTGHPSRLNRKEMGTSAFGEPDYSKEELIAEMGAAFLCGDAGIDVNYPRHAGYVQNWLRVLGGDPKLVVQAAGAATKSAELILGRNDPVEPTDNKEES